MHELTRRDMVRQITISLAIAQPTTTLLWKRHLDPDMYALPFQSAITDLIGQLLLVACYIIAGKVGADVSARPKQ